MVWFVPFGTAVTPGVGVFVTVTTGVDACVTIAAGVDVCVIVTTGTGVCVPAGFCCVHPAINIVEVITSKMITSVVLFIVSSP